MPTPAQHRQALANMAALYGSRSAPQPLHRPRSPDDALRELQAGARSLADLVKSWEQVPAPGDLAGVRATLAGLGRVAAELIGGSTDGAA